jgi:hypothetical protein
MRHKANTVMNRNPVSDDELAAAKILVMPNCVQDIIATSA